MADEADGPRRRGRPKGSGLDDSTTLSAVLDLLDAQPGLRPTTAIKQLGIVDPSAIRRLRDKLTALQTGGAPDPANRATSPPSAQSRPTSTIPYPRRTTGTPDVNPRSGAGTRVRERLGMPTSPVRKPNTAGPALHPVQPHLPALSQRLTDRPAQTVAHMKLLLEATAALTKLHQALLAELDPPGNQE